MPPLYRCTVYSLRRARLIVLFVENGRWLASRLLVVGLRSKFDFLNSWNIGFCGWPFFFRYSGWAAILCFCCCLGCVPYLMSSLKDVEHSCGKCGAKLAKWHNSGRVNVLQNGARRWGFTYISTSRLICFLLFQNWYHFVFDVIVFGVGVDVAQLVNLFPFRCYDRIFDWLTI